MRAMDFRKISGEHIVSEYIHEQIAKRLSANQRVLWLVAGGSAMKIAAEAARLISPIKGIENLTVTLTDERYGPPGHKDSNWRQLNVLGFDLPNARLLPVLTGQDFEQTTHDYAMMLNKELSGADYSIALAGMGPDGHIFGIKPHSPAVDSGDKVVSYKWDDYNRLTPTINLIRKIDEVVIYAAGKEKHVQIVLLGKEIPATEQPAQQLKQLKNVIFFNDYKGEEI